MECWVAQCQTGIQFLEIGASSALLQVLHPPSLSQLNTSKFLARRASLRRQSMIKGCIGITRLASNQSRSSHSLIRDTTAGAAVRCRTRCWYEAVKRPMNLYKISRLASLNIPSMQTINLNFLNEFYFLHRKGLKCSRTNCLATSLMVTRDYISRARIWFYVISQINIAMRSLQVWRFDFSPPFLCIYSFSCMLWHGRSQDFFLGGNTFLKKISKNIQKIL